MRRGRPSGEGQIDLFAPAPGKPAPPPPPPAPAEALPDQAARDRIQADLDTNLLVEAGAGAGKTTEMVSRMLALVVSGVPVERIAAVTFTRKAAAELRERFQNRLESELRTMPPESDEADTVDRALRGIDRAFIGTIHAFCARLLRERPIEAGVDPGFREVFGPDQIRLSRRFWSSYVERAAAAGDAGLANLRRVALSPAQVYALFAHLVENPDIEYPLDEVAQPEATEARARLEDWLDRAADLLPAEEPEAGWDRMQEMMRQLGFHRRIGWLDDVVFLDVLSRTFSRSVKLTQNRYDNTVGGRAKAKRLAEELKQLADDGPVGRAVRDWRAHRYPIAMTFAKAGAAAFEAERRRNGTLFFTDLLLLAARLLRESPAARRVHGERYRHLLVDEFQDTDPLQAEVLLLLASDPDTQGADWRTVVPREGALFVVGDPKQSIYRFRRADIALYGMVRARFEAFGAVLMLVSNFRSTPPIERFVNAVFEGRFPKQATREQAGFAPLLVRRADAERQGVFWYQLGAHKGQDDAVAEDSDRLASWIADRIASGERGPDDFLVLTRRKKVLAAYARALESRNVPVQVTGAGLGIETELSELKLLLEALADPADATLTLAVLVGLFFGLDYESLAAHVLDRGGRVSFTSAVATPATDVERALAQLNQWWRLSRREPADVVVARIVDEQGLLPYAAGGPLGESRAGALLFVLDTVRKAALEGDATLAGAIAAIEAALESDEAEAPLEPGRTGVVRLMNLHQAKGLEANVVVLAAPAGRWLPTPDHCVSRDADGLARGWTLVQEKKDGHAKGTNVFAAPADWETHVEEESRFDAAEEDRLLYVASTRAREELLVARSPSEANSPWAALGPVLERDWPCLELPSKPTPPRARIERSRDEIGRATAEADTRRAAAAGPTHRFEAVTARVKGDPAEAAATDTTPRGRGPGWGTAVHGALEAVARGASGDRLRAICRSLLVSTERPLDDEGQPIELDELIELVHGVATSDLWKAASRAARHGRFLVEAPFSIALPAAEFASFMARAGAPAEAYASPRPVEIVEGIIDLAFHGENGWIIVDYKSDSAGKGIEARRRERYRAQVGVYAAAWERITGEDVAERILLYTATGDLERW